MGFSRSQPKEALTYLIDDRVKQADICRFSSAANQEPLCFNLEARQMTDLPTTSDLPFKEEPWLEEPTKPLESDFKDPENYKFAFEEYQQKLTHKQG